MFFIPVANIIQKFNETIEANKIQATKNSNYVDRLDKILRVATSCSSIAHMGYKESGTFFLDTDGIGQGEVPYEVNSSPNPLYSSLLRTLVLVQSKELYVTRYWYVNQAIVVNIITF